MVEERALKFQGKGIIYAKPMHDIPDTALEISVDSCHIRGWHLDCRDLLAGPVDISEVWEQMEQVWPEYLVIKSSEG